MPLHRVLPVAAVLLAAASLAGQTAPGTSPEEDRGAPDRAAPAGAIAPLARSYNVFGMLVGPTGSFQEMDLLFTLGRTYLRGAEGGWMIRADAGGGMALWGTVRDAGYLLGGQIGVARVWTGRYLELPDGEYESNPLEFYAALGGGGYRAWNMKETPGERYTIPVVSAGLGVRFRSSADESHMASLELLREERIGVWPTRYLFRLGFHFPREGSLPPAQP